VAKPFGFSQGLLFGLKRFFSSHAFFRKNSRKESQEEACQNFYRSHRPEIAVWGEPGVPFSIKLVEGGAYMLLYIVL
jgi:hypothetical protein